MGSRREGWPGTGSVGPGGLGVRGSFAVKGTVELPKMLSPPSPEPPATPALFFLKFASLRFGEIWFRSRTSAPALKWQVAHDWTPSLPTCMSQNNALPNLTRAAWSFTISEDKGSKLSGVSGPGMGPCVAGFHITATGSDTGTSLSETTVSGKGKEAADVDERLK